MCLLIIIYVMYFIDVSDLVLFYSFKPGKLNEILYV